MRPLYPGLAIWDILGEISLDWGVQLSPTLLRLTPLSTLNSTLPLPTDSRTCALLLLFARSCPSLLAIYSAAIDSLKRRHCL